MEKSGGSGRISSHDGPPEGRGLGAIDLIAIVVVITLLGAALGALVADRSGRTAPAGSSWMERLAESVVNWVPHSEAQETTPTSPPAH
jgi:hypothetical protein